MSDYTRKERTEYLKAKSRNKTGFLGVKKVGLRFEAYIRNPVGKKIYCGSGKTAEEAAMRYDKKTVEFYGTGAVTNF